MEKLTNSPELRPDSTVLVVFPGLYSEGPHRTGIEIYGDLDLEEAYRTYETRGKKIYFHSGKERAWDHETVTFDTWLQHNHGRRPWLPDGNPRKSNGVQLVKADALYRDTEGRTLAEDVKIIDFTAGGTKQTA